MNSYVVDASYVLNNILPDEAGSINPDKYFVKFLKMQCRFISSDLLFFEISNALLNNVRRKRLNINDALFILEKSLLLQFDLQRVDHSKVLTLASQKQLSGYDASYLYLALSLKVKLLSFDKQLIQIYTSVGSNLKK